MVDNGRISTFIVTIAVIILGALVANPQIIQGLIGDAVYAQYGAFIIAVIAAVYNIAYPRLQQTEPVG